MHYLFGGQDSRNFGSLGSSFFSKTVFFLSCLSLMGFPFSVGFYSKDTILGSIGHVGGGLCYFLFVFSCCFTVAYSIRLIFIGFFLFPSFFVSIG